jgi:superfamily II DNA or RNA helicase
VVFVVSLPCIFYTPYIRDLGKDYPHLYYKELFFKVQVFSLIFFDFHYLTNLYFIYATPVNSSGIFEMATGTGKTFTALGCANKIFEDESKVLLIITCSYQHLTNQWKNEIKKFGIEYDNLILAYSGVQWKDKFANSLIDLELGYIKKLIVLTTHRTFSSDDFIRIIQRNKRKFNIMLIADEVHWLGAKKSGKGLIKEYDFRLGLSATPQR